MADSPNHPQLQIGWGYNNAFLLLDDADYAARLWSGDQKLCLTVRTDYPALVLYSGGFLGPDTRLHHGRSATASCAIALECQPLPDPFHLPGAGYDILKPQDLFHRYFHFRYQIILCTSMR